MSAGVGGGSHSGERWFGGQAGAHLLLGAPGSVELAAGVSGAAVRSERLNPSGATGIHLFFGYRYQTLRRSDRALLFRIGLVLGSYGDGLGLGASLGRTL